MNALDGAHDALNRMRSAHNRGTGCHLTAEMIQSLGVTLIAEMWETDDPRKELDEPDESSYSPVIDNESGDRQP